MLNPEVQLLSFQRGFIVKHLILFHVHENDCFRERTRKYWVRAIGSEKKTERKLKIDADRKREKLSTENPHDLEGITIIPCINHQILRLALRAA